MKKLILGFLTGITLTSAVAADYESLPGHQKREILWENIVKTEYPKDKRPNSFPLLAMGKLFNPKFLSRAFSHEGDRMIEGRPKLIHALGSTARVKFVPAPGSSYTGLLGQESIGLLRISVAAPVASFTAGMAIKFFVDGQDSRNIFAMYSLDGQGKNMNVFAKSWSNKIAPPEGFFPKLLATSFDKAIKLIDPNGSPFHVPSDRLFTVNPDGSEVSDPHSTSTLTFVPQLKGYPAGTKLDLRQQLDSLKSGEVLFHLYDNSKSRNKGALLGSLILEGPFIASKDGDENLYFRH